MALNKYNPNNTNVKSLIGAVNKQLRDYYNTFGGQSNEYLKLYSKVTDKLQGSIYRQGVTFNMDKPEAPLQISTGKSVLKEFSDAKNLETLQKVRNELHNFGTALERAQPYLEYQKNQEDNMNIKEIANILYQITNNQTAIYNFIKESDSVSYNDKLMMSELFTEMNTTSKLEYERLIYIKKKIIDIYNKNLEKFVDESDYIESNDYNSFRTEEFQP